MATARGEDRNALDASDDLGLNSSAPVAQEYAKAGHHRAVAGEPGPALLTAEYTRVTRASGLGVEVLDGYLAWNDAVADHFYFYRAEPETVYLDMGAEAVEACAAAVEPRAIPPPTIEDAVAATLGERLHVFDWHAALLHEWHRHGRPKDMPPPVLPILAIASMAANKMEATEEHAATNYYRPLFDLVGLLDAYVEQPQSWQQGYRRYILEFWSALERWLEDCDLMRGIPTAVARSGSTTPYVAMAMSQALMRRADVDKLPRFFRSVGLRKGQVVGPEQMEKLLGPWIPDSSINSAIKRQWESADVRAAVAAVAVEELASWDGTVPTPDGSDPGVLRIAMPRRRRGGLRFAYYVEGAPGRPGSVVDAGTERHAPEWVEYDEGWLDRAHASYDLLLRRATILNGPSREPRELQVFRGELSLWVEVPRTDLESEFMVVAHQDRAGAVEMMLSATAGPGWTRTDNEPWVLFQSVRILRTYDDSDVTPWLRPLVPLSASPLRLEGGLRMPGRRKRWHAWSPPELTIMVGDNEEFKVTVTGPDDSTWEVRGSGPTVKALKSDLPTGSFQAVLEVLVSDGWELRGSVSYALSDGTEIAPTYVAEQPRPPARDLATTGLLGAGIAAAEAPSDAEPALDAPVMPPMETAWSVKSMGDGPVREKVEFVVEENRRNVDSGRLPCHDGGPHVIELPMGVRKDNGKHPCKWCGGTRVTGFGLAELPPLELQGSVTSPGLPGSELLLDALGYLRGGRTSELHRWLGSIGLDGLARHDLIRELSIIQFADVSADAPDGSGGWHVLPRVLSGDRATGSWTILGPVRRPELQAIAAGVGGRQAAPAFTTITSSALPGLELLRIRNLADEGAAAIADTFDLEVRPTAAKSLLESIPRLRRAASYLPPKEVPTGLRGNAFRTRDARFTDSVEVRVETPGLYRVDRGFTRDYRFVGADGLLRDMPDAYVGKFLASGDGTPFLAIISGSLVTPSGARLPDLIERAIFLATHSLPVVRAGVTDYGPVPPDLLSDVYTLMVR